jgi:hypothetical protein
LDAIQKNGIAEFEKLQNVKEQLLRRKLQEFNEDVQKAIIALLQPF